MAAMTKEERDYLSSSLRRLAADLDNGHYAHLKRLSLVHVNEVCLGPVFQAELYKRDDVVVICPSLEANWPQICLDLEVGSERVKDMMYGKQ